MGKNSLFANVDTGKLWMGNQQRRSIHTLATRGQEFNHQRDPELTGIVRESVMMDRGMRGVYREQDNEITMRDFKDEMNAHLIEMD